ncbi:hypothetical protein [Methanosarcina acetivorans]|uniref:Uncharacterized protein n=1 Tax=Methanosarcina acetivorans (strain ATCC 35395 / DSM 2834 / JCM 12185 / C2A) TaxID=188937 RepID=Q8TRQ1_METAC|nr:hypothetical protein [Methanosarcina acetivorans]AAM04544.1 predicted protein [Methanosarcina acetivorans C2A]
MEDPDKKEKVNPKSGERNQSFRVLKVLAVAVAVLFVIVVVMISPLILQRLSYGPTLWLAKLDYEPEYYVEITPEELKDFPTLQGLNNKSTYGHITELETTSDERDRLSYLISQKEAEPVYPFEMLVRATVWSTDEVPTDTPPYTEITVEDLEQFPPIKKTISQPYPSVDRWYGISSDEWDSFLKFTNGYNEEYSGVFLKFGDQVYYISNTYDMRSYLKIEGEYYEFSVGLVG